MKSAVAAQVAIVLLLVASAASCEVAKEYSNRVFKPTMPQKKPDSTATALRFMHFDSENASDSVDLKDFANKEFTDNDKTEPLRDTSKTEPAIIEEKKISRVHEEKKISRVQPVDAAKRGTTRTRKVRQ